MSISYAKKRRILLFVLLFPTILAIVLITVLGSQQARAKRDAKKWLKANRPKTELVSVSFGEKRVDGVVTEKTLDCKCFDTEYGFFYTQQFESNGFRYTPVSDEYESPTSYAAMTETVSASQYLGSLLTEAGVSCDVLWYPTDVESKLTVVTDEGETETLVTLCETAVQCAENSGMTEPEILVCNSAVREAIASADSVAVWKRLQFSLPNSAVHAAADLLGKEAGFSGVTVYGTYRELIEHAQAQENMRPDDSVLWLISPWQIISGSIESSLMFWELK